MSTVIPPPAPAPTPPPEPIAPFDVGQAPVARRLGNGRIVAALILIGIGVFWLLGNAFTLGGGALFLGLGAAFLVARVLTGRYGYAVPAGLLLGFGTYVALEESGRLIDGQGGWFFVTLALGFVAVYAIGLRPLAIWPVVPAAILLAFGLFLLYPAIWTQLWWAADLWPIALVLIGVWLLARDRVPSSAAVPLAALGGVVLALIVLAAAAAGVASVVGPVAGPFAPFAVGSAGPLSVSSATASAPIGPGDTLRVVNSTGGQTTVRVGTGPDARVIATERAWWQTTIPTIQTSANGGVTTVAATADNRFFGISPRIDYAIEVPSTVSVDVESTSGAIQIAGVTGSVHAQSSSGSIDLSELTGPVTVSSSSGSIHLADLSGELRANTSSGSLSGTNLGQVRGASSSSGSIALAGTFNGDVLVQTSSGSISLRLTPASSTRVNASSNSGSVSAGGLDLANLAQSQHSVTGVLGAGAGNLTVRSSSGSISLAGG